MLNFKSKWQQQEQGFTLVEVLVAILITTVFVMTAMQAVVIAAVFKARARQYAEATTWIQKDLESVKQQAAILGFTTLTAAPTPINANSLSVSSTTGFMQGNRLKVGTISTTLYTISNISNNTITVSPALTPAQILATPAGTPVSVVATDATDTTLCYANTNNNQNNRFGEFMSNNLPPVPSKTNNTSNPNIGTQKITGKDYTLTRTPTVRLVAPFEVLQITYSVAPQNAHTTLTSPALATSTTLNVASANGFKAGDKLTVGTDTDNVIQNVSGNNITLTNQLGSAQALGAVVDASIAIANTEVIPDAAFQCP